MNNSSTLVVRLQGSKAQTPCHWLCKIKREILLNQIVRIPVGDTLGFPWAFQIPVVIASMCFSGRRLPWIVGPLGWSRGAPRSQGSHGPKVVPGDYRIPWICAIHGASGSRLRPCGCIHSMYVVWSRERSEHVACACACYIQIFVSKILIKLNNCDKSWNYKWYCTLRVSVSHC